MPRQEIQEETCLIVSDEPEIDDKVWMMWIRGFDVADAAQHLLTRDKYNHDEATDLHDLLPQLMKHIRIQYTLFDHFAEYLSTPSSLFVQTTFPFKQSSLPIYLETYFNIDEVIWWEMYGRKTSCLLRKDTAPDVADKCHTHLKSTVRQLSNLRSMHQLTRQEDPMPIVTRICQQYLLPTPHARMFLRLLVSMHHRIETSTVPQPEMMSSTVRTDMPFCPLDSATETLIQWCSPTSLHLSTSFTLEVQHILRKYSEDSLGHQLCGILGDAEDERHTMARVIARGLMAVAEEICSPDALQWIFDVIYNKLVMHAAKHGFTHAAVLAALHTLHAATARLEGKVWGLVLDGVTACAALYGEGTDEKGAEDGVTSG
ncbi:Acidic fibroblast growth factor binding [Carpediemonas membranifera]|uniref:Acidic fibroblast growth factor binding n=1 Tax=Carpediemonas membranifera TaxID=201153 RepID=A0A8J6E1F6_9EUKA|nr:Acidic fibroblast growth factor binding [Carpediemonas membranifera]|eukprot:KAG9393413.1 Acidic fibroblast growth factor binding [Carpediemonas membranifera]